MTRFAFALLAALFITTPAFAQDHTDVVGRAQADLKAQHIDLAGDCGAFKLTNLTVIYLRQLGEQDWGVLAKPGGGAGCSTYPDARGTEILAKDAAVRLTGEVRDLIIAAGIDGGNGKPGWGLDEPRNDVKCGYPCGNWRDPVDPALYGFTLAAAAPLVTTVGTQSPSAPGPPVVVDLSPLLAKVAALEQQLGALSAIVDSLTAWSDRVETRFNGDEGRLSPLEARPVPTSCNGYVNVFGYHAQVSGCSVH